MNKKSLSLLSIIFTLSAVSCGNNDFVFPIGEPDYSKFANDNIMRVSGWIAPFHPNFEDSGNKNLITQEVYNKLGDCGFNAIYAMYEYNLSHKQYILDSLNYAQNAGIKYYAKSGTIYSGETKPKIYKKGDFCNDPLISSYKDHPNFVGHLVTDEPSIEKFDALAACKNFYETELPNKEFYVNLFPSYASNQQLGTDSYEEYIQTWINKLHPDVLSFDHYSLTILGSKTPKTDSLTNRELVAYECKKANIPFMNFSLVTSSIYEPRQLLSKQEMKWQIIQDLVYGSSGIQYFCVCPVINGDKEGFINYIIDENGDETIFYNYAQGINKWINDFDETFLNFSWQGTIPIKGSNYPDYLDVPHYLSLKHSINTFPGLKSYSSDNNSLIGCFNSKTDNYKGFMLSNFEDPADDLSCEINLEFSNAKYVKLYSETENKIITLKDNKLSIKILPGDGCFIIPFN